MAGYPFRLVAGRVRARIPAGGGRLLRGLPALGLASAVLHRRAARFARSLYPGQGAGTRGVARVAHRLGRLRARRCAELAGVSVPRALDDDDERRLAWHAGPLSDLPPVAAPFQ